MVKPFRLCAPCTWCERLLSRCGPRKSALFARGGFTRDVVVVTVDVELEQRIAEAFSEWLNP